MRFNQFPNHSCVLIAIACLLGMGCSSTDYWLLAATGNHGQSAEAATPSSSTENEPITHEQSSPADISSVSVSTSSTVRSLEDILRIKSLSEQQLALHIFLSELDEAQVVDLLARSQAVFPDTHRYELQFPIIQRLAHQNPSRALTRVLGMYTGYDYMRAVTNVFREWAHSNINEAVSRARTLDPMPKGLALNAIVNTRMDLPESTLRAIALDLGNEKVAISAIAQRRIEEAITEPEKAWNEWAIHLLEGAENTEIVARIGTVWIEKSGLSVLDRIYQSLADTKSKRPVIHSLLEQIAQSDPEGAFNFALTIESDLHNSIVRKLGGIWAESDPRAALETIAGIEREEVRNAAADAVVGAWAQSRPREMLESLDSLPADLQETVSKIAVSALTREFPEEAAQFVAAMESSPLKTSSAKSVASAWSRRDLNAALEWILDDPGIEEIRSTLLFSIMGRLLVDADPLLAMTTVLAQAIEGYESDLGLNGTKEEIELEVISALAKSNLELAIDLLPQLHEGRTRFAAFKEIAGKLIEDEEIDRAFSLAEQIAEFDIQNFHIALAAAWAESDLGELLNSMDRFAPEELKSKVSFMLLDDSRYRGSLSDEQVLDVRRHLTNEHRKALEEGDSDVLPPVFQDF
ncbi:MAG: hypothetical protein F4X44_09075 [Gammaproteobacteria bacterium]|nr:hypothetical protein [Gammaproteobacteria bacterium]MYD80751.1 hypothetical protein [Gammaproteobacteria bacterium]